MKKNVTKALKTILTSAAALVVGFAAIAFPFRLFDGLSPVSMRYLFIGEMVLYFTLGIAFLYVREKRADRKAKERQRRQTKRIKFEQAKRDYYDFAA